MFTVGCTCSELQQRSSMSANGSGSVCRMGTVPL